MYALFTLAAYVLAFLFLFTGIRRGSAELGKARGQFETWGALIVYPAVYIGSSFGADFLNQRFGENVLHTIIALAVMVYVALLGVSLAAKRLRPPA